MNNIKDIRNGKKKIALILAFILMASVVAVPVQKTLAESVNIWQVNGKFTLSKKKLVTYCALYSAASEMKKKKRTFKITPSTKFIHVKNYKKKVKKSEIGKYIKKIKKAPYFQFKFKNGAATEIYYYEE
jgi:hypothetical protein